MFMMFCFGISAQAVYAVGVDGIWKAPGMNFYVQTYETGSAVVIVTADGEDIYVFLDSDVTNGINATEYFRRPASLTMNFMSNSSGTANLNGEDYSVTNQFPAVCSGSESGIWKDVGLVTNFWYQVYPASAIVVMKSDSGNPYVFMDEDYAVGENFDGPELFGRAQWLTVNFQDSAGVAATPTMNSGPSTYIIVRCFPAACWNSGSVTPPPPVDGSIISSTCQVWEEEIHENHFADGHPLNITADPLACEAGGVITLKDIRFPCCNGVQVWNVQIKQAFNPAGKFIAGEEYRVEFEMSTTVAAVDVEIGQENSPWDNGGLYWVMGQQGDDFGQELVNDGSWTTYQRTFTANPCPGLMKLTFLVGDLQECQVGCGQGGSAFVRLKNVRLVPVN